MLVVPPTFRDPATVAEPPIVTLCNRVVPVTLRDPATVAEPAIEAS